MTSPSLETRNLGSAKLETHARPRVGLDFDDTLMPTREAMFALLNAHYGTSIRHDDCPHIHFITLWSQHSADFTAFFNQHEPAIHQQKPYEGVLETLAAWAPHVDFYVLTARPDCWKPSATTWLRSHGIQFRELISTNKTVKSIAAKTLNLNFFVDDRPDFAADVASAGIPVYLLDRPYNQNFSHPLVTRVKNWHELSELVNPASIPHLTT